ncbi:hypothetical protein C8R43DRAFT_1007396 [Mycena crocata]|nr:hypothetical protein C8R43DRAFT_1007396 [Mycena crocata]
MASTSQAASSSRRQDPNNAIWQWTLTPEAVASCYAQDVFGMRESDVKDADFFWLGRVPCRSVKVVGLIVGVQTYETRIVYYVDDGTAVVEGHHRPPAPNNPKQEPPPLLKPVANVGDSVILIGRVSRWRDTRRILVDSIGRCPSANDEPRHWIAVRKLHATHYSLQEPFVIPPRPATQIPANTNAAPVSVPTTPSSSAPSSPFKSPPKTPSSQASPHKLRHPSRLQSRDLTDNAFRIYLKHYMDNADDLQPPPPPPAEPSTPTKSSRNAFPLGDETPRPLHDRTPRRIIPLNFAQSVPAADNNDPDPTRGFTLSYLRRVPELALMAKRVVKAEAKRRAREARKKAKEAQNSQNQKPAPVTKAMQHDAQKLHPRMKRLFIWAIQQLVKDGDIVQWEGATRPCAEGADPDTSSALLWKANSSGSTTVGADSTVFSSASIAEDDEDEGVLTDPEAGEEGWVSLTPAFLARTVEKAIGTLVARTTQRAQSSTDLNRLRLKAPAPGPTAREIMSHLRNHDDMWRNLSEFAVKEALVFLQDEGRAWMTGGDRWELTV